MPASAVILAVAAFLTAMISGIIGMGGGILMLATLFCFLPHGEAIPSHAAVQLVSNTTRVLGFLPFVDWITVRRFCTGAVPGAILGAALLWALGEPGESEPYLKSAVGAYVLTITALPKPKPGPAQSAWWDFPLLGLAAGTAGLTLGAIGPLIAPVFARRGFVKERLIATKAVCQTVVHLLKIPTFLLLRSLEFERLGALTLLMIVMVIPGTFAGKAVLKHVTESQFVRLYRIVLFVAGTKVLLCDGLWPLMRSGLAR